jgi:hypothetical protein
MDTSESEAKAMDTSSDAKAMPSSVIPGSTLNPIEIPDELSVAHQSPPAPTTTVVSSALERDIDETMTVESAHNGCDDLEESTNVPHPVKSSSAVPGKVESLSAHPMGPAETPDKSLEPRIADNAEEESIAVPGGFSQPTTTEPKESPEETTEETQENVKETTEESTKETAEGSIEDGLADKAIAVPGGFSQLATTESKESPEETIDETQENAKETTEETAKETETVAGTIEDGLEENSEKPSSLVLSQPAYCDETPGWALKKETKEDLETTFEQTDEEDLEDAIQGHPEKSEEAEKDEPVDLPFSSSVALRPRVGADEQISLEPDIVESGSAPGIALQETKPIPEESFWGQRKVKYGVVACFLLAVIGAVVGAVVALGGGSSGVAHISAPPTLSPTTLAPSSSPSVAPSAFDLERFRELLPDYSQAALLDENSSQAKAFVWLESDSDLDSYSNFQRLQRFALATLFYATNGDEWLNSDGWVENFPFDECERFMSEPLSLKECANGHHEEVTLDRNGLTGTLPDELAILTDLQVLRLSFNDLTAGIPSRYGLLTDLKTVDLALNFLTGPIPSELLTGWSKVKVLGISGNSFSGAIPSEVGMMSNVEYVDFSNNALEGRIPSEFALLTNLETLYLHSNAGLSGGIPSEFGRLSNLRVVTFDNTNISGTVPREVCDLLRRNFVVIELDCNRVACDCGCTCV